MTRLSTLLALSLAAMTVALPATAGEIIRKVSPHSVAVTMDRLELAVNKAGATVFARVDHAEGAQGAGMELAPAQLLIFGNPQLGTPAMQASITAGLDLPMRVLVHADKAGGTQIAYRAPQELSEEHGVPGDLEVLDKMAGALDKLTDQAASTD